MTPDQRTKTLTGTVTTHVAPQEELQMKLRAEGLGISKSEWCRRTLLNALSAAPETRLVVSELAAMRSLFLTLHLEALKGSDLTQERLRALVEQADREKYALAEKRIQTFCAQDVSSTPAKSKGGIG